MPSTHSERLRTLSERLRTFFEPGAGRWATLAVVIVLLGLLGNQSLALYRAAMFSPPVKNERSVTGAVKQADYNATTITRGNLFGHFAADPEQLQSADLPTTHLQVILRGVFTSSDPREASAIIERPDGKVRTYNVNAVVFGHTRLHAVFNDRIVLSTNGKLETLYFPQPGQDQSQPDAKTVAKTVEDIPQNIRSLVENNMTTEEIRETGRQLADPTMTPEQRTQLIRQRLLELRKRARENHQ